MKKYHKLMSFFSYLFGFIALIAIIVNDKKNKLYSFYIWQAFLLNTILAIASIIYSNIYIPNKILTTPINLRPQVFTKLFLIPFIAGILLILVLGILAYKEVKFNIPLIGTLAQKITKYKVI